MPYKIKQDRKDNDTKNRELRNKYQREYRAKNKEKIKEISKKYYTNNKEKIVNTNKQWRLRQIQEKRLWTACKARATKENLKFNIDVTDIIIPEYCPYLGIKLVNRLEHTFLYERASVDKIIPNLGYIKGNVEVISLKANMMKQAASREELVSFAKEVLKRYDLSS